MKKIVSSLVAGVMLGLLAMPVSAATFDDVDDSTYYYESIEWMADNGVINGYGDGTFGPDNCVQRGEMLKMLFETLEIDENDYSLSGDLYSDVSESDWFGPYVYSATELGVVEGYDDGTFKPGDCVNRAEAVKMAILQFNDGEIPPISGIYVSPYDMSELDPEETWWYEHVASALGSYTLGLDHFETFEVDYGDEDMNEFQNPRYNFEAGESMTRKEVAEMLYRMKVVKDTGMDYYDGESVPDEIETMDENEFDVNELELGDMVGDWEVMSIGYAIDNATDLEWNMSVEFDGEVTVKGTFESGAGFDTEGVSFIVDEDYTHLLPISLNDDPSYVWFAFDNSSFAREQLIDANGGESGSATVVISNYHYVMADTAIWDVAELVEVVSIEDESSDDLVFDVNELELGDMVGDFEVTSIGYALDGSSGLENDMSIEFSGEITVEGEYFENEMFGVPGFYIDGEYAEMLPRVDGDDSEDVWLIFANEDFAREELTEGDETGTAMITISHYTYVRADAGVSSTAVLVEVLGKESAEIL